MRLPRCKIRSLLGVVLFDGIAIAALRGSTDARDSGVRGLTLLSPMTAVLLAVHRTDRGRTYWLGFALFGRVQPGQFILPEMTTRFKSGFED